MLFARLGVGGVLFLRGAVLVVARMRALLKYRQVAGKMTA
jgi:hypothetical protein